MFRRMKLRIFDATTKRSLGLSTNFSRQTRNFRCPALYFLSFADKLTFFERNSHTRPQENTFLDLRPKKRPIGWEKNSKQFLLRCCYTNFHPFARKSQLRTPVFEHKIVICGSTNKNEYSRTRAKIA